MSSLVNCVVVRDGMWSLYGLGGGIGDGVDYLFASGPEATLRWLEDFETCLTEEWFQDPICEAGVLLDVDEKLLLLFAWFNYVESRDRYPFRAAMLDAYRRTWSGWQVRWAYDGVGDLLDYVGEDRTLARYDGLRFDRIYPYDFWESDPAAFLVSIADDTKPRVYGLTDEAYAPWLLGPPLLDQLDEYEPLTACEVMPRAGLHLDPAARRAGLWSIHPLEGLVQAWPELWPGWSLDFWQDDYGHQVARCPGLVVPSVDLAPHLTEIADRVAIYVRPDIGSPVLQQIMGG